MANVTTRLLSGSSILEVYRSLATAAVFVLVRLGPTIALCGLAMMTLSAVCDGVPKR